MQWFKGFLLILAASVLISCTMEDKTFREQMESVGIEEGLHNIYDDEQSSVFIMVDEEKRTSFSESMSDLMVKKKDWKQTNLTHEVISISVVTFDGGVEPIVFGLLIHYECRQYSSRLLFSGRFLITKKPDLTGFTRIDASIQLRP